MVAKTEHSGSIEAILDFIKACKDLKALNFPIKIQTSLFFETFPLIKFTP
jgi:hypothetical protein